MTDPAAIQARFRLLTQTLADCDALVTRLADERAVCAAELKANGETLAGVARILSDATGTPITRARAQQLVDRGRAVLARHTITP